MTVTIWHNPACGTSRNVVGLVRAAGIEPLIVEYFKTPPSRAKLLDLIRAAGLTPRDLLRKKGTPFAELGLGRPELTDGELVDAMLAHPVLIERPLVETPLGTLLCRPSELVLQILPAALTADFVKEDGEIVPAPK